jgi:hypothetical protein
MGVAFRRRLSLDAFVAVEAGAAVGVAEGAGAVASPVAAAPAAPAASTCRHPRTAVVVEALAVEAATCAAAPGPAGEVEPLEVGTCTCRACTCGAVAAAVAVAMGARAGLRGRWWRGDLGAADPSQLPTLPAIDISGLTSRPTASPASRARESFHARQKSLRCRHPITFFV